MRGPNGGETRHGDKDGVGSIRRTTWKSALPYKLEFDSEIVRVERHRLIEAHAFGELDGHGLWQFDEIGPEKTRVQYDWVVKTTKSWMNLISPIARPFFRWNHNSGNGLGRRRVEKTARYFAMLRPIRPPLIAE